MGEGRTERWLERGLFAGRWLLAPVYAGLLVAVGMVTVKFAQELIHAVPHTLEMSETELVLLLLSLIDLSLAGNLLLMVAYAGYENFISQIHVDGHADRPAWMDHVDFGDLKLKLMSSIVAISAIHLLRSFMAVHDMPREDLAWQVGIHLTFVISAVLLARMDRIGRSG